MVADQRPGSIRVGALAFLTIALAASIALADFCPKCGKEIDATDNFCRKCGKNLKSSEEPKQEGNKEKGPEQSQSQHQQVVIVIQKDGATSVKGDQKGEQKPPAPLYQATFSFYGAGQGGPVLSGKLSGTKEEVELWVGGNDLLSSGHFTISLCRVNDQGEKYSVRDPIGKFDLDLDPLAFNKEFMESLREDKPFTQPLSFVEIKQNLGYRAVIRLTKRMWYPYPRRITYGELRVYPDSVTVETEK